MAIPRKEKNPKASVRVVTITPEPTSLVMLLSGSLLLLILGRRKMRARHGLIPPPPRI